MHEEEGQPGRSGHILQGMGTTPGALPEWLSEGQHILKGLAKPGELSMLGRRLWEGHDT